ncbi:lipoprotein [Leptospira sp. WS92.C1]
MKKIISLILLLFLVTACSPSVTITSHDQNQDGKIENKLYTKSDSQISIFMETFEHQQELPDDWMWLKIDSKDPKSFQTFYNEMASKEPQKIDRKIWFGPNNLKLIEKKDQDQDGYFETTQYYNRFAKPKISSGIIARIEIDLNKDQKPDLWIYPMKRVELDTNQDGIPDRMSLDPQVISDVFKKIKLSDRFDQTTKIIPSQSWVIHPEFISDESLRAVILFSL